MWDGFGTLSKMCPTNYDLKMITAALTGNTRHKSTSINAARHEDNRSDLAGT